MGEPTHPKGTDWSVLNSLFSSSPVTSEAAYSLPSSSPSLSPTTITDPIITSDVLSSSSAPNLSLTNTPVLSCTPLSVQRDSCPRKISEFSRDFHERRRAALSAQRSSPLQNDFISGLGEEPEPDMDSISTTSTKGSTSWYFSGSSEIDVESDLPSPDEAMYDMNSGELNIEHYEGIHPYLNRIAQGTFSVEPTTTIHCVTKPSPYIDHLHHELLRLGYSVPLKQPGAIIPLFAIPKPNTKRIRLLLDASLNHPEQKSPKFRLPTPRFVLSRFIWLRLLWTNLYVYTL
ncbi:hypothetical protein HMI54_011776 [Coelomomyces lativittatus]|nr:hypothetical protein HMI54_011776 [Coelomomyces lativittatus]